MLRNALRTCASCSASSLSGDCAIRARVMSGVAASCASSAPQSFRVGLVVAREKRCSANAHRARARGNATAAAAAARKPRSTKLAPTPTPTPTPTLTALRGRVVASSASEDVAARERVVEEERAPNGWFLVGCDSDAGGALAVVRGPSTGVITSVDVIDAPTMKVEVNGRARVRLDVDAMCAAVRDLRLPPGTVAHVEEGGVEYGFSAQTAFVQGYNFGLWKGVLASAGLTVVVVKPQAWKWALGLARKGAGGSKDESRAMAKALFPEVEDALKRKKDHGRAESLLIAAYGHMAANARHVGGASDPLCARVRDMVAGAVEREENEDASDAGDGTSSRPGGLRARLGPDDPLPYFGPYFGMTGKELSREAKSRGLKCTGKKMELVERLEAADLATAARGERERERGTLEDGTSTVATTGADDVAEVASGERFAKEASA
eukprot:12440-Pelagococcus_subviridis.AAC.8